MKYLYECMVDAIHIPELLPVALVATVLLGGALLSHQMKEEVVTEVYPHHSVEVVEASKQRVLSAYEISDNSEVATAVGTEPSRAKLE